MAAPSVSETTTGLGGAPVYEGEPQPNNVNPGPLRDLLVTTTLVPARSSQVASKDQLGSRSRSRSRLQSQGESQSRSAFSGRSSPLPLPSTLPCWESSDASARQYPSRSNSRPAQSQLQSQCESEEHPQSQSPPLSEFQTNGTGAVAYGKRDSTVGSDPPSPTDRGHVDRRLPIQTSCTTQTHTRSATTDTTTTTATTNSHFPPAANAAAASIHFSVTVPQIELDTYNPPHNSSPDHQDSVSRSWSTADNRRSDTGSLSLDPKPISSFPALALDLSSNRFGEELSVDNIKFSVRGSMLLNGNKVNGKQTPPVKNNNESPHDDQNHSPMRTEFEEPERQPHLISAKTMPVIQEPVAPGRTNGKTGEGVMSTTRRRAVTEIAERPQTRYMSTDEESLSQKVRSLYSHNPGTESVKESDDQSIMAKRMTLRWQDAVSSQPDDRDSPLTASRATSMTDLSRLPSSSGRYSREQHELAGGIEDWEDVDNADVDRYGFIIPRSPTSSNADEKSPNSLKRSPTAAGQGLQRVSTALQLAADTPRRKHTVRRSPSNAASSKSGHELRRSPSNQSFRSVKSLGMYRTQSTSRAIANKFPHNRDRKILDEAGDMLTLPHASTPIPRATTSDGTQSVSSSTYTTFDTPQARRKEFERQQKWQKMARPVPSQTPGAVGGGMTFTFDTSNPKLIERTWKGIPDTWRATAWDSFLAASVTKHNARHPDRPCLSDAVLTAMFHEYQDCNSPDDVQIDIDVPRTISSHIMFRRRYRGGQRLLFRVLHAMSMHFAETGYVQGMAAIAATLLAYYSEEKAFIMLVRLWELRGLENLYKNGFGGLMEALNDFEQHWLGAGELRQKLDDLNVIPTSYGAKWYLTLFNYSIPFPSQLRVWDVFMLLGDDTANNGPTTIFGSTLDILHAASAALIDGMRGILLESDFETAMKVLTSWVPIRDEDLFMRVARAEWKMHAQRRKS